jgi:hypothetical protein
MPLQDFKKSVLELRTALSNAKSKGINLNSSDSVSKVYDFNKSKEDYYRKAVHVAFEQVKKKSVSLGCLVCADVVNGPLIDKIKSLVAKFDSAEEREETITKILSIVPEIKVPETNKIKKPDFLPSEIKADVYSDILELEKAFNAGCYRSAAILCGRILEIALHRKYFEVTDIDLLEKSPGIGLGKIVAKLSEKNISFDPGLMQQIHLINNVRISSVHIRQEPFNPTKAQAQAMILYTLDILEKIFKK